MTRREAWLSVGLIFVAAVVVRAWFASALRFPTPEDTAYYVGVARNIVEGRGLVSDAIWSFHTPPLVFPRPAFEVWLPLPSLLALPAMAVFGPTFDAAKIPAVLVGSLVPVLAWRLAADVAEELGFSVGRARTLALGTGLTAVVVPAAGPVWRPARLDHAVRRSGPGGDPADDPAAPPATRRRRSARPAPARARGGPRPGRADPQRGGLAGPHLGGPCLVERPARPTDRPARHSGRNRPRAVRAVGRSAIGSSSATRCPARPSPTPCRSSGFDIFAWNDPPTLSRYLAVGPVRLVELRVEGIWHNLVNVLIVPGFPVALIGLIALPWTGRVRALRPLVVVSVVTFLVTSLLFPVATTWGTFLHAAGAIQVLLIISALLALDGLIDRIGAIRGWTRPVAWLGPTLTIASGVLFSVVLTGYIDQAAGVARRYELLADRMAAIGRPLDRSVGPIVTDFPIWLAEALRLPTLALPDETPADVVDLAAAFPGTRYLVMSDDEHGAWPEILAGSAPGASCFHELDLGPPPVDPADARAFGKTRVFEIGCP